MTVSLHKHPNKLSPQKNNNLVTILYLQPFYIITPPNFIKAITFFNSF